MRRAIVVLAVTLTGRAFGQPAFDVASITPTPGARTTGEGRGWEHISWTPTSVTIENASLSACIQWAYEAPFYEVSGPTWTGAERFDIVAKTDHPAARSDLRLMLRTLLAQRFRLSIRRETKTMPVYALVAGKDGVRLQAAETGGPADIRVSNGQFVFRHVSMAELAERLSNLAGMERPVIDRTAMAGAFDFTLPAVSHQPSDGEPGWLFTAVERQLGLALKPEKAAIPMLLIEHAERPSPN